MYELRDLPGVDALQKDDSLEVALSKFGPAAVKQAIRNIRKKYVTQKKCPVRQFIHQAICLQYFKR